MRAGNTADFDCFYLTADAARDRFHQLPGPLLWVEPSINMPHLEASASYVLRQDLCCVLATAALLEHVLRIAVIDCKAGSQGSMSKELWDKYSWYSITDFVDKEAKILERPIASEDIPWWRDFAGKVVRNKTMHLDIPHMLKNLLRREEYVGDYKGSDDEEMIYSGRGWWGSSFHHSDSLVAIGFLREATAKLTSVIERMGWKPDRSYWASQELEYNDFFRYPWTLDAMTKSLERVPRDLDPAKLRKRERS